MIVKTITFNTGRKYTAEGQFIMATLYDDDRVTFMDHSRGVDGEFRLPKHCSFNQTEVMHWYDSGMATSTKLSWEDGFMNYGSNVRGK